ncbi:lipocalin family protein [Lutimonas saemankumensis]|uniref:lipocalin family protein n=1 Tax=Lutimonas saemankumensis TaxID=483016 RepID=UPI001CD2EBAE|nr:lipocalin family protein [Lutimonas saemankumensis]MCA0933253.1 lipocalin family protein [Lutimonas saemankumensis]
MKKVLFVMLLAIAILSCTESESPEESLESKIEGKWKFTRSFLVENGVTSQEVVNDGTDCEHDETIEFDATNRMTLESYDSDGLGNCSPTLEVYTYSYDGITLEIHEEGSKFSVVVNKRILILKSLSNSTESRYWETHFERIN